MLAWTIYERPADYPQGFIVRAFRVDLGPEPIPTTLHFTGDTLDAVRAGIPPGLVRLPRVESDPGAVVETWL